MINWPEMPHHAEDWAAGFWAGGGAALLIVIVGAVMVLLARGISTPSGVLALVLATVCAC
jgi:hypothetical protein